ncbi:MAG TPA: helix-turn-helix transcriptional regulator [Pseudoneobacillus sp.]|nr:helix-turn-helix transcriptional regulator [Pseudoneobacillus sp.]
MEAEKWGRRIRAYRKLKGYTQESFSNELGVSVSIVGEIERGSRMATNEILDKICKALKVSLEELTPPKNGDI